MQNWSIAGLERAENGRRREEPSPAQCLFDLLIAERSPAQRTAGMDEIGVFARNDHAAVGQAGDRPGNGVDALLALLQALLVQDRVHLGCGGDRAAIALGPGGAKDFDAAAAAVEAGA